MSRRLAVLRSVTIVSVSTYLEYALGLVISIWIARSLGPADFGRYAFTIWLCGWLIVCSNNALTTSSIKFIAEVEGAGSVHTASHLAHSLSRMQNLSSLVVIMLFVLVSWIFRPTEWHEYLLPVTALVIIAVAAKANFAMLVAIEKGQERFEPGAIATVVGGVIGIGLITAASLAHAGLLAFVAIFAVASLILNLINRLLYRHYCQPITAGPIPVELGRRLHRHLRLTAVLVLLGSLKAGTIEVFLLNTFTTSTAVGFFAIAGTLTRGAVELFSVGLTSTLLPYMAKSFGKSGQEETAQLLAEATRFYWAVGIAIAGIGLVTTPEIVTLMYGQRYLGAIPAIQATLVLAGLLLIGNGINAFQTVVDRQDDRVRITLTALVANAVFGIALVPTLGLLGAVLTYAGTRIVELGLAIVYLRRATTSGLPLAPMARLFAVGVVATAAAWVVTDVVRGHYGFVAGAIVFTAIYVPASVLVSFWNTEDYKLMVLIAGHLGLPGRVLMRGLSGLQGLTAKAQS
jgi:O-antigen/teichoic acid export membrane protein